jgi:hypothetical protein
MKLCSRHLAVALTLALASTGLALADTLLVQKHHKDAFEMMGQKQPAKDFETHMWLADDRARLETDKGAFIVRFDKKQAYFVREEEKAFTTLDLPIDFAKLLPPEMQAMAAPMLAAMTPQVKVTPTDETQVINGWKAKKTQVQITQSGGMGSMTIDMTMWLTKDVKIDLQRYRDLVKNFASLMPGTSYMKSLAELDGISVRTESVAHVMGQELKSSEETVSISEKAAPAGTYDPPAGFTEQKFNPLGAMGRGKGKPH